MDHHQHRLGQSANQSRGGIDAGRRIHHDVTELPHQHVEQAGELSCRGLHGNRSTLGPASSCKPAAVAGHETFQQGTVETMQVADGIGHSEQRLQIHVQRRVSERGHVDQRGVAMGGLQGQGEIYRDRGGAVAAFGIDYGKNLAARALLASPFAGPRSGGRMPPEDRWWWWDVR